MNIRGYASGDVDESRALIETAVSGLEGDYTEDEVEHLKGVIPDMVIGFAEQDEFVFYVAEKDEDLVGIAGFHPEAGKVAGIFVRPENQRQGIGGRLIEEIERAAEENGTTKLEVLASLTAEDFYQKLGFETREKVEEEMGGRAITVYVMEKQLGQ